jgi:cytochrome c553
MKKRLPLFLLLIVGTAVGGYAADGDADADAKAIWGDTCKKCHGVNGNGDTKMGKKLKILDYTKAEGQAEFTDEEAFKAIKEGVKDENGKTRMKPAKDLTDEQINALVQYVRCLEE